MPGKIHVGAAIAGPNATVAMGRILVLAAIALYFAGLLLPFLHGSIRLLVVPVSRSLTLPAFAAHLAHDGRYVTLGLVMLAGFVAPVALLLGILPGAWPGSRPLAGPLAAYLAFWRWRGWAVAMLGGALTGSIRASSGVDGTPSLRLLAGAWAFVAALVAAAAVATLIGGRRERPS